MTLSAPASSPDTPQDESLQARLARHWRQDLASLHAYVVQDSRGLIKLDVMENPYGLPDALQEALGQRLGRVALNRYPAEGTTRLKEALCRQAGLPEGCGMVLGNGSDELITLLSMVCDRPGATVMAPLPGFVMYQLSAFYQGLRFEGVPLTPDFQLDVPAMREAMRLHQPAIVYLAYPNNPTGNLFRAEDVQAVIDAAPGFVVMDEAYQPFASRDSMAWLRRHPHVLVMRTLSKFGLAGVRVGYLMGRQEVVDAVEKLRPPFNLSVLNTEAALFALEHESVYQAQAQAIRDERARVAQGLAALLQGHPGCQVFPSEANMLLVRVPDAAQAFDHLKRRGILIKNLSAQHPLLSQCLRITVGTPDENQALLAALAELWAPAPGA